MRNDSSSRSHRCVIKPSRPSRRVPQQTTLSLAPRSGARSAVSSGETELKLGHRWCCGCPKSSAILAAQSPDLHGQAKAEGDPSVPSSQGAAGRQDFPSGWLCKVDKAKDKGRKRQGCRRSFEFLSRGCPGGPFTQPVRPAEPPVCSVPTQHRISLPAASSLLLLEGHLPSCNFCPGKRSSLRSVCYFASSEERGSPV